MSSLIKFISLPFYFAYDSLISLIRFAWSLIGPDPRRNNVNPLGDVNKFIEDFESKYGTAHVPFFRGSYAQALDEAKKELKFLIVYLQSDSHQDTADFCQNVLCHSQVTSYINRNSLVFWGCSVSLPEGYRVSQALHENTYPFLVLIVLKEHRMTVVRRFEGNTTVERFLSQLQEGIVDNEVFLAGARADRNERNMNQMIRQEQDEAYKDSLKADQEKERKRQEERKAKEAADAEKRRVEEDIQKQKDLLIALKSDLGSKLPAEPSSDAAADSVIRVLVKLPDGTRLERRFERSLSIRWLYAFVFAQPQSPLAFQITTNFPRRVLPGLAPTVANPESRDENGQELPNFVDAGLSTSEMLFVTDTDA